MVAIINPISLWALLQTSGTRKLTVDQYGSVRAMIRTLIPGLEQNVHLPHYRTITRTLRPLVLSRLAVPAQRLDLDTDLSKKGARASLLPGQGLKSRVSFVSPIEYAKADIRSTIFFNHLQNNANAMMENNNEPHTHIADSSPYISGREWFTGEPRMIGVGGNFDAENDADVLPSFDTAEKGDTIVLNTRVTFPRNTPQIVRFAPTDGDHIQGIIASIFQVHHADSSPRLGFDIHDDDEADERTAALRTALTYFNYTWPYPSIDTIVNNNDRLLVQPSDICAILRPSGGNSDDRLVFVHRFLTTPGERRRFVFIIEGDADLLPLDGIDSHPEVVRALATDFGPANTKTQDIQSAKILARHGDIRGWRRFSAAPLLGHLAGEANEPYVIYRCTLYVDAFVTGTGKVSFNGIYLQPLSIPPRCRTDGASARVVAAIPPGVSQAEVMRHLIDEYIAHVQTGAIVIDGNGQRRRVFVDIVNLLGDTPGMNAFIDVLGTSGDAPCHRCNYHKLPPGGLESRNVGQLGTWNETASRRSGDRHTAIRQMQVPADAYQRLGMKANPNEACSLLYYWRHQLYNIRHLIPSTTEGTRVVPHLFDPHASVAIGPDHVIGNHLDDILNAICSSLPPTGARRPFISVVNTLTKERSLPTENRMFAGESHTFDSMQLTQKYTVLPFIALSYDLAINALDDEPEVYTDYRTKLSVLLHTFTTFIGQLWRRADSHPTRSDDYIAALRTAFTRYWTALAQVIEVPDAMHDIYTNDEGVVNVFSGEADGWRLVYNTIRILDKPNLHRFLEHAIEQGLFYSHACWTGELSLERTHQRLKAVMRKTNKKQEQVLMMNAARFNDWQGRLTCLYSYTGPPQNIAFGECASLISGVGADGAPAAIENPASIATLLHLLHPNGVVAGELRLQDQRVYGNHGTYCVGPGVYSYELSNNRRNLPSNAFRDIAALGPPILQEVGREYMQGNPQMYALRMFRLCRCPRRRIVICTGDLARRFLPSQVPGGAGTYIYEQILFFMRSPDDDNVFEYVARAGTVAAPDANLCRHFTQTVPPQYTVQPITPASLFLPTTHACSLADCVATAMGNIIHEPPEDEETGDVFLILDSARAFPPRKG